MRSQNKSSTDKPDRAVAGTTNGKGSGTAGTTGAAGTAGTAGAGISSISGTGNGGSGGSGGGALTNAQLAAFSPVRTLIHEVCMSLEQLFSVIDSDLID